MKISISLSDNLDPRNQAEMAAVTADNIESLAAAITQNVWSPVIFKERKRREDHFDSCDILSLDFDDGIWTLESAKNFCLINNYAHIIATTKSHQKTKGEKPACDRFRLIIPFQYRIKNIEHYKHQLKEIMVVIPCDPACKDGARFFYPCKDIHSISLSGGGYPVKKMLAKPKPKPRKKAQHYANNNVLPNYIRRWIENPAAEGDRNNTCFRIACEMAKYHFPESEIISAVLNSNNDLSEGEKLTAARSGIRRGSSNRQ